MRGILVGWFVLVLLAMLWITVSASLERGVFEAGSELWRDHLWFRATLIDAYLAFAMVWLWIAWREPDWGRRGLWLVLVATMGNFAMAAYALMSLARWRPEEGVSSLLIGPYRGREITS